MKIMFTSVLIMTSIFSLGAQIQTNINLHSSYDDNLYRSPLPESDLLSIFDLNISYSTKESSQHYYLNPSYFSYQSNSSRSFLLNQIGFGNKVFLNKMKSNILYFGGQWDLRINDDSYNYYDYNQLYGYANLNFNLKYFILKSGYNYRYRSYSNLPDLTNNRHYLFVHLNKSFPSRTTFILEADIGHKSFMGQELYDTTSGGTGQGQQGTGRTTTIVSEIPSLSQAIFLARISQSLHPKVGVFIQYRKQISLNEETDYVNSESYFQDEELFDDPFSYKSDAITSQLTWIMPWKMRFRIGGASVAKKYISETAYVSAEDSLSSGSIRMDDQQRFYFNISKTFFPRKSWLQNLNLSLNYAYVRNQSNSYWYDYKNSVYSAGFNWNF